MVFPFLLYILFLVGKELDCTNNADHANLLSLSLYGNGVDQDGGKGKSLKNVLVYGTQQAFMIRYPEVVHKSLLSIQRCFDWIERIGLLHHSYYVYSKNILC